MIGKMVLRSRKGIARHLGGKSYHAFTWDSASTINWKAKYDIIWIASELTINPRDGYSSSPSNDVAEYIPVVFQAKVADSWEDWTGYKRTWHLFCSCLAELLFRKWNHGRLRLHRNVIGCW